MSSKYYTATANKPAEFNITLKNPNFADIVIPHCYVNEPVAEVKEEMFKCALEPGDMINITDEPDAVTQAADLNFTMKNTNMNSIQIKILVLARGDKTKIEKRFSVTADLSNDDSFNTFCGALLARLNPPIEDSDSTSSDTEFGDITDTSSNDDLLGRLRAVENEGSDRNVRTYSLIKGVWVDPTDKTKLRLKQLYPQTDTDPDHFTDFYLTDKVYIKYRPILVVCTEETVSDLVVMHLSGVMFQSPFWKSFGRHLSDRDFTTIESIMTSSTRNEKFFYYLPTIMAMIVNNYVLTDRSTPTTTIRDARRLSHMKNLIQTQPEIKQVFEFFLETYFPWFQASALTANNVMNLFGFTDLTGFNFHIIYFFKAVFVAAYTLDGDDSDISPDWIPDHYSRIYGVDVARRDFVSDYVTAHRTNKGIYLYPKAETIGRNVYCPITQKAISFALVVKKSTSNTSPVLIALFDDRHKVLSQVWLKKDQNFFREYATSIALDLVNEKWKTFKDIQFESAGVYVNTFKCISLSPDFGVIQSAGYDRFNNSIYSLREYLSYVNDINTDESDSDRMAIQYPMRKHNTFTDDNFLRNFVASAAGAAVACMKLHIGDRHDENELITDTGNVYPIDFGLQWNLNLQFYCTFLWHEGGYKSGWDIDTLYRKFSDILRKIDVERTYGAAQNKNYLAAFRTLCTRASAALDDTTMVQINTVFKLLNPSQQKDWVHGNEALVMSNVNIKELYDQFKTGMETNIHDNVLPAKVPKFVGFDFTRLHLD